MENLEKIKGAFKNFPKEKIVSGNEVMEILGLKSGKEIGIIISKIKDLGMNREEALSYLHSIKK